MSKNDKKIYFSDVEIEQYKNLIDSEYEIIEKLKIELSLKKKNIQNYEKILLVKCQHNRQIDSSCPHDRTIYCTKCGLNL